MIEYDTLNFLCVFLLTYLPRETHLMCSWYPLTFRRRPWHEVWVAGLHYIRGTRHTSHGRRQRLLSFLFPVRHLQRTEWTLRRLSNSSLCRASTSLLWFHSSFLIQFPRFRNRNYFSWLRQPLSSLPTLYLMFRIVLSRLWLSRTVNRFILDNSVISCVERVDTRYVNRFMYRYMNHFLL